jgi:hypothetical protein
VAFAPFTHRGETSPNLKARPSGRAFFLRAINPQSFLHDDLLSGLCDMFLGRSWPSSGAGDEWSRATGAASGSSRTNAELSSREVNSEVTSPLIEAEVCIIAKTTAAGGCWIINRTWDRGESANAAS